VNLEKNPDATGSPLWMPGNRSLSHFDRVATEERGDQFQVVVQISVLAKDKDSGARRFHQINDRSPR
jgi:hypothetical protein